MPQIAYIRKDVNNILLVFVLALLFLFSWSTVYYENRLKNASSMVSGNFVSDVAIKGSFQEDKKALEERHYLVDKENEELKSRINALQEELDSVKSELDRRKNDFDVLQQRYVQLQDALIKANDDLSRLSAKNKELCNKLKEKGEEC